MPASRVSARPSSSEAARYSASAAASALRASSAPSLSRAATRSHSATSACCCASRAMPDSTSSDRGCISSARRCRSRARGAVAEVALGDLRRQQQQRAADAHVGLAASPLHQREQPLDQLLQPPGRARQLGERFVQRQVLGRGLDGAQLRLEGRLQLALRAQAVGHLRGDLRLGGRAGGARQPLLEQPGELVVRARGQQRPLQPRRLLRVLDRRREGGVEELVGLARRVRACARGRRGAAGSPSAPARRRPSPDGRDGPQRRRVVCTSRVR